MSPRLVRDGYRVQGGETRGVSLDKDKGPEAARMNEAEQNLLDSLEAGFFRLGSLNPDDFLPETVYHYTSASGLYGIVSSGTLWGSNYSYLNDTSEITYGRELVHEVVHERVEAEESSFLNRIYDRLASTPLEATDFYLTCFCQTPDRLSQWRGYGGQSGRYCIGLTAALWLMQLA